MEARISDRLRALSSLRHSLVERVQQSLKSPYFSALHHPSVVHISLITTTLTIVTSIYAHARSITLFTFHPVFMTIGSVLLIGEGIVAYRNKLLLEFLSPIMQHNRVTKVRAIHQSCQIIGASFLFLGLMFIFANKVEYNRSLVPKSVHSIIGSILLLLLLAQVISGDHKLTNLLRSNITIRRWHGDAGLLVWDLICVTVLLGLIEYIGISLSLLVNIFMIMVSWYAIQLQLLRKSETGEASDINAEGSNLLDDSPAKLTRNESFEQDEFIG